MSAQEPLSLPQRLTLVKWLTDELKALRADELLPASEREMPPGSRIAAMFGGKQAGWVSVPQPAQPSAYVKDPKALLAWAKKNYRDKVEPTVEVTVDDDLIAFLAEKYPSALVHGERVQPAWVSDILGALVSKQGYYATITGEKLTEVPGVEIPEAAAPAPRVNLTEDAAEVIGKAWRDGDIPMAELLALPAAGGEGQ